jgi:histidinol-phosphate aminotransferase
MRSPVLSDVSRRSFLRYAGVTAAVPFMTEAHFAWAAQQKAADISSPSAARAAGVHFVPHYPPDAVLINANENPMGPSPAAREAIAAMAAKGGRYDFAETQNLIKTFAAQNGIKENYIEVYAGSSEPLHYTVMAFASPERPYVMADPSYEAGAVAAGVVKAPVVRVPLTSTHAHDVRAMISKNPTAGLYYICNPNNPTGSLTPREDMLWALENKPKGSILLVDEAYIHLSDSPSMIDQVALDKDIIILRTFSKVYGMAGIRCGMAVGRPDLLRKLQVYLQNAMPVTASAAAYVSLKDPDLVPTRKKIIGDIRNDTFAFLTKNGYVYVPSQSNCFMVETHRPAADVIAAMREKRVFIGRVWPIWPTHVRVTVGSADEMKKFQVAFKEVMDAPPVHASLSRRGPEYGLPGPQFS